MDSRSIARHGLQKKNPGTQAGVGNCTAIGVQTLPGRKAAGFEPEGNATGACALPTIPGPGALASGVDGAGLHTAGLEYQDLAEALARKLARPVWETARFKGWAAGANCGPADGARA